MAGQLIGLFLGLLGLIGTVLATLLPAWRSSSYMGANTITAHSYMKGLWMECVWHSINIYQCEVHRSLLALPPHIQAARVLMVLSCIVSTMATLVSVMGMKCTRFAHSFPAKNMLLLSGGVSFLCAGLFCLVTVCWTTHDAILDFSDPFLPGGMKHGLGMAVYVGYTSACLSLTAGLVLCWNRGGHRKSLGQTLRYPPPLPPSPLFFSNVQTPAPPYQPPTELMHSPSPSLHSVSSSGYRLNDCSMFKQGGESDVPKNNQQSQEVP